MPILEHLLNILAPHDCLFCGLEGQIVCNGCLATAFVPIPSRCYRCYKVTDEATVCQPCQAISRLKQVWIASDYTDYSRKLIHVLKFGRARAAHQPMASLMAAALPYLPPSTLITHLPTATSRVRRRGYDHAQLIAREIAHQKGCRYQPLLRRHGQSRQVGAKREQRLAQINQAFKPNFSTLPKDTRVIIVDDVTTTGATLEAAAWTLRQAGLRHINAAVFSQKQ